MKLCHSLAEHNVEHIYSGLCILYAPHDWVRVLPSLMSIFKSPTKQQTVPLSSELSLGVTISFNDLGERRNRSSLDGSFDTDYQIEKLDKSELPLIRNGFIF